MAAPVTKEASSEHRNATTDAISDGAAARDWGGLTRTYGPVSAPTGASRARLLAERLVATTPGHTQLALIPRSAYSTATARVNWSTPPFDASYAGVRPAATSEATEPMVT